MNVSQASVSNALLGKRHLCNPEIYARIWEYATTIGYRGRGMAAEIAPAGGGLKEVAVIFGGDPLATRCDPGLSAVLWACERELARRGILVVSLGAAQKPWRKIDELARGGLRHAGWLVVGEVGEEFQTRLLERPRRIVTIDTVFARGAPAVVNHDEQAAELLLTRLQHEGHVRIQWLGGGHAAERLAAKLKAVTHAAAARGVTLQTDDLIGNARVREAGRRAARELLRRGMSAGKPPSALVCAEVAVARGAIDELASAGVAVPRDLSVVALDGSAARAEETPAFTSAGSDPEAMGTAAAELLADLMPGMVGHARTVSPPARLHAGETCGPAPRDRETPLHLWRGTGKRRHRNRSALTTVEQTHAA